jgi:hypothetical protein
MIPLQCHSINLVNNLIFRTSRESKLHDMRVFWISHPHILAVFLCLDRYCIYKINSMLESHGAADPPSSTRSEGSYRNHLNK